MDAHSPLKVGARLAEARHALGLELQDIAERTRIPLRHLEAIEKGDYTALPATTYAVGFVKTYSRIVGLDDEAVAAEFRAERGECSSPQMEYVPFEPADPSRVPPRTLAIIALGTAMVLAAIYLIWRGAADYNARSQIAAGTVPAAQAPAIVPVPHAKPVKPTRPAGLPAPSDNDKVVLTAAEQVWVKISEKGGPTLFIGELAPGQRYEVPPTAKDPRLQTGRPQSLSVTIGPRTLVALGPPTMVIRDLSLKAPALIARDAAMPKEDKLPPSALPNPVPPSPGAATPAASPAGGASMNMASPTTP